MISTIMRSDYFSFVLFLSLVFCGCEAKKEGSNSDLPENFDQKETTANAHRDLLRADSLLKQINTSPNRKKNARLLLQRAEILIAHKEFNNALEDLQKAGRLARDAGEKNLIPSIQLNMGKAEKELNHFHPATEFIQQALKGYQETDDSSGMADCLNQLGSLAWKKDSFETAEILFLNSYRLYQATNDPQNSIKLLINLGFICREQNKLAEADRHYNLALELARKEGDSVLTATCLHHIGGLLHRKKDYRMALLRYQESLALRTQLNDPSEAAQSWQNIALLFVEMGQTGEAAKAFNAAVKEAEKSGDNLLQSSILSQAGNFYLRSGEYLKAHGLFLRSLDSAMKSNDIIGTSRGYSNLGSLFKKVQNPELGLDNYRKAVAILQTSENKRKLPSLLNEMGSLYFEKNAADSALLLYQASLLEATKYRDNREIATALKNIGRSFVKLGDTGQALVHLQKAERICREQKNEALLLETLNEKGGALQAAGKTELAMTAYKEIETLCRASKDRAHLAQSLRKQAEIRIQTGQIQGLETIVLEERQLAASLNNPLFIQGAWHTTYLFEKRKGNSMAALMALEAFKQLSDSLQKTNLEREVMLKQAGYEMGISETLRHAAEIKMGIQQQLIQRQRLILILLIAAATMFAVLLLLIYNRYLLKKKTALLVVEKYQLTEKINKQLRDSEDSLRKLNITKDKFFSIIAHDIRNPLTGLIAFTDLVLKQGNELSHKELLDINQQLNEASKNLFGLLDNLLQWARSQAGSVPFHPTPISLNELINTCVGIVNAQAANKQISLKIIPTSDILIWADHNMVLLVLRNLLSNALKFTPSGGEIVLSTKTSNAFAQLEIQDTGVGMSPETLSRLFRIDEQVSSYGTNGEAGSGLGLILCREFVEKNGGTISAESEIHKGSRFIFTIPTYTENSEQHE